MSIPNISIFVENFEDKIDAIVPDVPGAKQPVTKIFTEQNDTLNI